eukprot:scaffold1666_cov424-Prasinococcus_capsulatus_cf.AAC.16
MSTGNAKDGHMVYAIHSLCSIGDELGPLSQCHSIPACSATRSRTPTRCSTCTCTGSALGWSLRFILRRELELVSAYWNTGSPLPNKRVPRSLGYGLSGTSFGHIRVACYMLDSNVCNTCTMCVGEISHVDPAKTRYSILSMNACNTVPDIQ